MSNSKTVCIIPARGGSKAIPKKNIRMVAGHPLISWVIRTAQKAKSLDRIIVSTNDREIAEIAAKYDAEVPFIRPEELSRDDTPGIAPIIHAAQWLERNQDYKPDYILCLQPTSPLLSVEDINGAVSVVKERRADAVLSVVEVDRHPNIMKRVDEDGRIHHYVEVDSESDRRQDYSQLHALNGAIWLIRRDVLLAKEDWYSDKTYAYVMPPERSLDIDKPWDLHLANLILEKRGE